MIRLHSTRRTLLSLLLGSLLALAATALVAAMPPVTIADQGYFFVGGEYFTSPADGQQYMSNQMYVQYQLPVVKKHPYPIVMVHGASQTGANYLQTPDGREGWSTYFLRQGYAVYVVDQVGRGKADGHLHTQWPGAGVVGDPIYDQFYASQVENIGNQTPNEAALLNRAAGAKLFDRTGPAILLTHSQSGEIGWLIADSRPNAVKGLIAVEPQRAVQTTAAYGLSQLPIAYTPEVSAASPLSFATQPARRHADRARRHEVPHRSDDAGLRAHDRSRRPR